MRSGGVEQRLGMLIKRAEQALISAKTKALRPLGLTVPQYAALLMLHERPGVSGAELARLCAVTPQTMNTIVTNLEEKRLLERRSHPIHSHVLETTLTSRGRDVLERADRAALAVEKRLADAFHADERKAFKELLSRSVDALVDGPKKLSPGLSRAKRVARRATHRAPAPS
jgi:DNA-binding MarR family transcriptional regulator